MLVESNERCPDVCIVGSLDRLFAGKPGKQIAIGDGVPLWPRILADAGRAMGYRVELRIVVGEAKDVLRVPVGALFRRGDAWATFVARDGRAREVAVQLGRTTPSHAEALGGLAAGDVVVLYPSELLADGAPVRVP